MGDENRSRIRLRLPTGAEIEAEGAESFVRAESDRLLGLLKGGGEGAPKPARAVWEEVAELGAKGPVLRSKPAPGAAAEACLLLLGAARELADQARPTATQLARWLRISGCPVDRIDRTLAEAIKKGELLASGSRRSRRYEPTASGYSHAAALAARLAHARLDLPGS